MAGSEGGNRKRHVTDLRLWKALVKWASRRGPTPHDSEDLVQRAYLRMEDQIRRGKEIREQEAFLKTAIKNLATDDFRRTRHEGVVVDQTEAQAVESDAPTPSDIVERDDRMRWLCAHLDKVLGKPTRDIFIYNRVQGYTYHEISELLGMSPRTIEKHIARALVVLTELKKTDDV